MTTDAWYKLAYLPHYEINEEGILRNTDDHELVPTFTYFSLEYGEEEMYALMDASNQICVESCTAEELLEREFDIWADLPGFSKYAINIKGEVVTSGGRREELHSSASGDYYLLQADEGGHPMTIFKQDLIDDAPVLFSEH